MLLGKISEKQLWTEAIEIVIRVRLARGQFSVGSASTGTALCKPVTFCWMASCRHFCLASKKVALLSQMASPLPWLCVAFATRSGSRLPTRFGEASSYTRMSPPVKLPTANCFIMSFHIWTGHTMTWTIFRFGNSYKPSKPSFATGILGV